MLKNIMNVAAERTSANIYAKDRIRDLNLKDIYIKTNEWFIGLSFSYY